MIALKLIPANESGAGGCWRLADDFDVVLVDSGETVGRIFRAVVSPGNPNAWFWSLDLPFAQHDQRNFGHAESRDAAERAFAECWRHRHKR
jgi:hypothetical protein